jgi:hypothetical protein
MAAIVAMLGPAWQRHVMQRPWDAIVWWELRRIPFNIFVLVTGVLSGGIIMLTEPMRSRIFWIGTVFSVAVTLLPAFLIPLIWIVFGFRHG